MPKLRPYLRRFEYLALRDKSVTDPAQVPVAATIDFFSPGAFVRTAPGSPIAPTDPDPTIVEVWDTGSILTGEQLAHGASTLARFIVNTIPDATHLEVSALQSTTLAAGDRLVRLAARPALYTDPYGTVAISGSSILCNAATGRASCYPGADRFDFVVSGGGVTPRVVPDSEGGLLRTPPSWINVVDYPSIQAAIDAVPAEGGVAYIPYSPVAYDLTTLPSYTPPIKLPANRSIRLTGDGPYASVLKSTNPNADMVHMAGDYQTIENLALRGPKVAGAGRGIRIWRDGNYLIPNFGVTATNIIYRAAIRDVLIEDTASWGIYVDTTARPGATQTNHVVWGMIERVEIRRNQAGGGIFLAPPPPNAGTPGNPNIGGDNTTYYFHMCHLRDFVGYGFRAQIARGISLLDCIFETAVDTGLPFVSLESCSDVRIQGGWFEGRAGLLIQGAPNYKTSNRYFIEATKIVDSRFPADYHNITIDGCLFHRAPYGEFAPVNPKVIRVGAGGRGVVVLGNKISAGSLVQPLASDANSISVLIEPGAFATVLGGSQAIGLDESRAIEIVDAAATGGGLSVGTMSLLRVPRVDTASYHAYDGLVKPGDIVYDPVLLALRVCIALTLDNPAIPAWRSIVLEQ